ncbi:MAG: undecaprenyl-phosphate glucose phosphotransferase [Roseiflexus sp.]|nr:undecaprenyl-phosphate glucose phosphotransferase [Roseiflexus sp.]MDW8232143.1 undecaprenyl-phosphate glucose phosphotransferase [Roseiflexaceae bacterium]
MAAISSAPRSGAASGKTTRQRTWVVRTLLILALLACDSLALNAAFVGAFLWAMRSDVEFAVALNAVGPSTWLMSLLILNLSMAAAFIGSSLYSLRRGVSRIDEFFKIIVAASLGTFATLIINAMQPQFGRDLLPWNERVLVSSWIGAVTGVVALRLAHRSVLIALRKRGIDVRRVIIVGTRDPGKVVLNTIRRQPEMGYHVVGFVSNSTPVGTLVEGVPVLGKPASLGRVIRAARADEVIIAVSGRTSAEVLELVALAEDESVEIKLYPDAFQLITNNDVSIGDVSGLPLIGIRNVALDSPINRALKRGLDLVVATLVLTLGSPVMLLIALLIKLESRGPVFFVQERVGLDGKPFPTFKFRTMRADAPLIGNWTTRDDPRVTPLGRFLRRYSLDELPQFINVIRGEMSVVGPRPEQPMWVERFSQSIPRYMRRHKQKAGITGWAQVNGLRGDTSIEERTRYDLYYVENWSLLFDIKIIIKTVVDILTGKNRGY